MRLRTASGQHGYADLAVRVDELTAPPSGITRAYIVENEITYLAFPLPPDAIVIFGGGYAVQILESLTGWRGWIWSTGEISTPTASRS